MTLFENPLSLYLHVPFCRIKCTYCAFNTYTNLDHLIEPFVQALIKEVEILGRSKPAQNVHTIYIGGGTPSLLSAEQLERILKAIDTQFVVLPDAEISMESNPSDLTAEYMASVKALGINRLSIGMQSANAHELELFARRHDSEKVVEAVAAARAGGFDNLNLDLIYGIPDQTLEGWKTSLEKMLTLQPEHVSLYALGLEEGTSMKAWVDNGKVPTPDDDLAADMYEMASDVLEAAGYEQYEISNWAKPGYECRHNLQYWRNLPYPGLGPGAHGLADGVRYSTILSPQRYIRALRQVEGSFEFPRTPALDQLTALNRDAEIADTLLMGLRLTKEGINRQAFANRFGIELVELHRPLLDKFAGYGLLDIDEQRVRITRQGRLLSNMIFRELV